MFLSYMPVTKVSDLLIKVHFFRKRFGFLGIYTYRLHGIYIYHYAQLNLFQLGFFIYYKNLFSKYTRKFCKFTILTVIGVKGRKRYHRPKGGEKMNPNTHEQDKQHAFDSFCKKVVKNEMRDFYDEVNRQRKHEVSFSEMSTQELEQLYAMDKYFVTDEIFNVLGLDVVVNDNNIAEALRNLPEQKRDIILLSYFLEMSDREIGDKLNMLRATVQYQRATTLQKLKKIMEGNDYGQQEDK